jgi:hypothetical protein
MARDLKTGRFEVVTERIKLISLSSTVVPPLMGALRPASWSILHLIITLHATTCKLFRQEIMIFFSHVVLCKIYLPTVK